MGERWCHQPGCLNPPAIGSVFCYACTVPGVASQASPHSTIKVMVGGETGEDTVGEQPWEALRAYFGELPDDLVCPAPTPEAP